jgi:Domain of unknown function (DUF4258)
MKGNGKPLRTVGLPQGEKRPGLIVACDLRGYSKVEFSDHALSQMKIRVLTREEVLETIRNPELKGLPTQPHRLRYRRYRGTKRAIDVVFEEWDDRIVVVTAMIVSLKTKDRPD